jgi:hypothetical protein
MSVSSDADPAIAPFKLVETRPGSHSLLLTTFEPADEVFERYELEGGGYAWEAVARHVVEHDASDLDDRVGFDPEASMFCAYGEDREALYQLGARLAALFHDATRLAAIIESIGPDGFDD